MRATRANDARRNIGRMEKLVAGARRALPYLLVALLVPGGTFIALGMLLFAQRKST